MTKALPALHCTTIAAVREIEFVIFLFIQIYSNMSLDDAYRVKGALAASVDDKPFAETLDLRSRDHGMVGWILVSGKASIMLLHLTFKFHDLFSNALVVLYVSSSAECLL